MNVSEFTSTPKGELFCKSGLWKVTLWWKHIATVQSIIKVHFMKLKVDKHF